jgi:hypothetical protein
LLLSLLLTTKINKDGARGRRQTQDSGVDEADTVDEADETRCALGIGEADTTDSPHRRFGPAGQRRQHRQLNRDDGASAADRISG